MEGEGTRLALESRESVCENVGGFVLVGLQDERAAAETALSTLHQRQMITAINTLPSESESRAPGT